MEERARTTRRYDPFRGSSLAASSPAGVESALRIGAGGDDQRHNDVLRGDGSKGVGTRFDVGVEGKGDAHDESCRCRKEEHLWPRGRPDARYGSGLLSGLKSRRFPFLNGRETRWPIVANARKSFYWVVVTAVLVMVTFNVLHSLSLMRSTQDVEVLELRSQLLRALRAEKERKQGLSTDLSSGAISEPLHGQMWSESLVRTDKAAASGEKVEGRKVEESETLERAQRRLGPSSEASTQRIELSKIVDTDGGSELKEGTVRDRFGDQGFMEIVTRGNISVCRISGVCIIEDLEIFLVPQWLSSRQRALEKCGLSNVKFVRDPRGESQVENFHQELLLARNNSFGWTLSTVTSFLTSWRSSDRLIVGPGRTTAGAPAASALAVVARNIGELRAWTSALENERTAEAIVLSRPTTEAHEYATCFRTILTVIPASAIAGSDLELNTSGHEQPWKLHEQQQNERTIAHHERMPPVETAGTTERNSRDRFETDVPESRTKNSPVTKSPFRDAKPLPWSASKLGSNDYLEVFKLPLSPGKLVCRVHNACRTPTGALKVSPWLQDHEQMLSQCGFSNVDYSLADSELQGAPRLDLALFGPLIPRDLPVNFVFDFASAFHAHPVVAGHVDDVIHTCIANEGETDCSNNRALTEVGMLFAERERDLNETASWIKALASLFPSRGEQATKIYMNDLHRSASADQKTAPLTCFGSIVGAKRLGDVGTVLGESHSLFSSSTLRRTAAFRGGLKDGSCQPQILLLHNGKSMPRQNVALLDALRDETETRFGAVFKDEPVLLGSLSPYEQFATVNAADVIISPSSIDLSNLVFVRPNAIVIEVHGELTRMFSGDYHSFACLPDTASFEACIKRIDYSDGLSLIQMWKDAVESESSIRGRTGSFRLDQQQIGDRLLRGDERFCVRNQRVRIDIKELTRQVRLLLEKVCRHYNANL